jgi:16S rRNA (guanine966-N2)-methyltransferase
VRESVANRLEHLVGGFAGIRVLDAYAGTGAMGLELLSRGAADAVFLEHDRQVAAGLRRAIADLEAPAEVLVRDAAVAARTPARHTFDLLFLDPPYDVPLQQVAGVVGDLVAHGWAAAGSLVVVEAAARAPGSPWPPTVAPLDSRDHGDTRIWYGQVSVAA